MLAKPWKDVLHPGGSWLSEKYDGLRAYWDGVDFWSREGNRFYAPAWFKKGLPRTPLDGELFAGRGRFQEASGTVRSQGMSDAWKRITFNVFDAPSHPGGFEARIDAVKQLVKGAPYAKAVKHRKAKSASDVKRELARVEGLGGEGLVLRGAGSAYEGRRAGSFLKVKTFHDAEAVITGYYPGKGKHKGVIGGFYVETLPDQRVRGGIRFKLGTGLSDAQRRRPPKIGTKVTYKFQGTSDSGTPRFASFLRVRKNPWWEI